MGGNGTIENNCIILGSILYILLHFHPYTCMLIKASVIQLSSPLSYCGQHKMNGEKREQRVNDRASILQIFPGENDRGPPYQAFAPSELGTALNLLISSSQMLACLSVHIVNERYVYCRICTG